MTEHKQAAAASQGEGQIKRSLETRHLTMIALGGQSEPGSLSQVVRQFRLPGLVVRWLPTLSWESWFIS